MSEHLGVSLAALVDGQLDHDDRDRAFAHVARCAACQADVAEQRALKARLSALSTPTMPGDMVQRLAALMAAPPESVRGSAPVADQVQRQRRAVGGDFTSRAGVGRVRWSRFPRSTRSGTDGLHRAADVNGRRSVAGAAMALGVGADARPFAPAPAGGTRPRGGRPRATSVPPAALARRNRMRTLVGASAVVLVAVAGGVTLADTRGPAGPAQPFTAPTRKVVPPASPAPPGRFTSVSFLPIEYVHVP